ncbi:MAG: carboxypeptidase-like regulatory domain-containing protein [Ferruginibacter sp.]
MRMLTVSFLCLLSLAGFGQNTQATISGKILDENDFPLAHASITILGRQSGIAATDSGTFNINVQPGKAFALVFSATGYIPQQKNFLLSAGENETIVIHLRPGGNTLETVIVTDERERAETGLIKINPKTVVTVPSPTGGVEALIKTFVGSNNELSSQYNVRGGNYDENLVYINDFEVYRPYLVSNGQQEGLSLINPELARNVNFYTGGFQAKYGDKISSVLDIQYKKPLAFGGSAYISLLEQGLHLEGNIKNKNSTFLAGVRNRSNRNVLSNQPTVGAYIPSASDMQGQLTHKFSDKLQVELLGIVSVSRFSFFPESVKKTASVFSPFYTSNIGLDVFFEGQEKDNYQTQLFGASLVHTPTKSLKLKWMLSRFRDEEAENFDIGGAYLFGERSFDNNSADFGQITNPLGAGYYQDYARNKLEIDIINASHKGSLEKGKHFLQWGNSIEQTQIKDKLLQWQYQDSAGYSLPYVPGQLSLYNSLRSEANLKVQRYSGYVQDNIRLIRSRSDILLQAGVRYNYYSLNKEILISPRLQLSIKPQWKRDMVFKLSAGMYSQPPFYREARNNAGFFNTALKAQKSLQAVAGFDYNFAGLGNRPFRFTSEAYYKHLTDVVPYDIDNVKIRYQGLNDAKAYATGLELRLFGELVKDAESWFSLSFMRTRENLDNDFYYQYKNAAGEIITSASADKVIADSVSTTVGYVRRPSDRLITAGLYLEDYLATNKNFKVHLNTIYGSNMSYNIPGSVRFRNALIVEPYIRVDIGFSAQLLTEKSLRRSHSPFRGFDNIWASLEVYNLINRENTISYQLIKDFSNAVYAIPNRLTPRLLNAKLVARF